jgi:hypothetical protein
MAKTEKQLPQTPDDKQHKGDKDRFDQKNSIPDFQYTPPPHHLLRLMIKRNNLPVHYEK